MPSVRDHVVLWWRYSKPWPHRCPDCRRWTWGALEGCSGDRFAVCLDCALGRLDEVDGRDA